MTKLQEAESAISRFFSDPDVDILETANGLIDLIEKIGEMLEQLKAAKDDDHGT